MGARLAELASAREVFDAVDDALARPLTRLMAEGPEAELTLTRNAQPALMAVSIATVRALETEVQRPLDAFCTHVAGHSLGEYSALVAAGSLDLTDAARLLELRGEAMQSAVAVGEGAMVAVLGLDVDTVSAVLAEVDGVVDVANDNADGQVVISGARDAVETATATLRARGARRVAPLPVSAPFHCRLMAPAAERMAEALADVRLRAPAIPVVANVTAQSLGACAAAVRDALVAQVCGRVRWRETMGRLASLGTRCAIEAGAGRVLTGLAKRGMPQARLVSLETADDVRAFAAELGAVAA